MGLQSVARQVIGSRKEPTITILLSGHNIKLIANELLLYPWIGASLNRHQTSFSLQYMRINAPYWSASTRTLVSHILLRLKIIAEDGAERL